MIHQRWAVYLNKGGKKQSQPPNQKKGDDSHGAGQKKGEETKYQQPCFFYQTGERTLGAETCRYQHVMIDKSDYEALKKKRAERAKEKGTESTKDKPRRASSSGGQNSGIGYTWQYTGDCPSISTCKWTHLAEAKGAGSNVRNLMAAESADAATSVVAICRSDFFYYDCWRRSRRGF